MTLGCANSLLILNAIVISFGAYQFYFKNLDIAWLALILFLAIGTSGEIMLTGKCLWLILKRTILNNDIWFHKMTMTKQCCICGNFEPKLFRCQIDSPKWIFLCQSCLSKVKESHKENYKYGGTWKIKK